MAQAWEVPGLEAGANPPFRVAAGLVCQTRIAEVWSWREPVVADADPEGVHAMRVSIRRLRSALDAFSAVFPARGLRRRAALVARLGDALGAARDRDVLAADLRARASRAPEAEWPGLLAVAGRADAERRSLQAPVVAALEAAEALGFPADLQRFVAKHTGVEALAPEPSAA